MTGRCCEAERCPEVIELGRRVEDVRTLIAAMAQASIAALDVDDPKVVVDPVHAASLDDPVAGEPAVVSDRVRAAPHEFGHGARGSPGGLSRRVALLPSPPRSHRAIPEGRPTKPR